MGRFVVRTLLAISVCSAALPSTETAWAAPALPGGTLAFASDRDSSTAPSTQIYLSGTDGTGLERLTNFPWWAMEPSWSPDGTRIAFAGVRPEAYFKGDFVPFNGNPHLTAHAHDIYVMNRDGSHLQKLTNRDRENDQYPAWSPDGSTIAFMRGCDPVNCAPHIALMGSDGSNPVEITHGEGLDFRPTWSPDGSTLAFERDAPDFSHAGVFVVNRDGSGLTKLVGLDTSGLSGLFGEDPVWSPEGNKIAFWNPTIPALQAVNVATKKVSTIAKAADLGPGPDGLRYASWSPDGRWLAIAADGEGSDGAAVYLVSSDGGTIMPMPNAQDASSPAWRPVVGA